MIVFKVSHLAAAIHAGIEVAHMICHGKFANDYHLPFEALAELAVEVSLQFDS